MTHKPCIPDQSVARRRRRGQLSRLCQGSWTPNAVPIGMAAPDRFENTMNTRFAIIIPAGVGTTSLLELIDSAWMHAICYTPGSLKALDRIGLW